MKIDSNFKPPVTGSPPAATGRPTSAKASTSSEVRLSEAAARLAVSDDSTMVNSARVDEIKKAISEGRFTINAGAIADSLIATARELIDSRRQA